MKKLAILALLAVTAGAFASTGESRTVNCSLLVMPFITLQAPSSLQITTTAGHGNFETTDVNNLTIGANTSFVITLDTSGLDASQLVTSGNQAGIEAFIGPWVAGQTYGNHGPEQGTVGFRVTNINEGNAVASDTPYNLGSFTITVSQA